MSVCVYIHAGTVMIRFTLVKVVINPLCVCVRVETELLMCMCVKAELKAH